MKGEDISERLLSFGVRVMNLVENLPKMISGRHIANQLIRCGTSAGANYKEARSGESRADFIHKMGIAWKELREATYWVKLTQRATLIKSSSFGSLLQDADELIRILSKSIQTARKSK